jgi:signal transduction histidine kinase
MRLPRIPTTFRIAALAMLLVLCSNLALLAFIHIRTHNDRLTPLRQQVLADASALSDVYSSGGQDELKSTASDMLSADSSGLAIGIFDRSWNLKAGNILLPVSLRPERATNFEIAPIRLKDGRHGEAGVSVLRLGHRGWLVSGRLFGEQLTLQRAIERSLALALLLSFLFGIICALILAQFVRRRVAQIGQVVDQFGHGDLALRAPMDGSSDVFDRLAGRINGMFDRIGSLMAELRMLTDSLAHDLRSPVSRLRAKVERAMTTSEGGDREAELATVLQEADALMRILTTVLEIGRYESLSSRDQFSWIDPGEFLEEIGDLYGPSIDEAGMALEVIRQGPLLPIFGHRQLLAQAMSNLIDNAMVYGGCGGAITLFAEQKGEGQCIGVADRGPGIPPELIDRALARFGRLDEARGRPGAGLGLTLVQAVAHLHGGRLELASVEPGLRAMLRLPGSVAQQTLPLNEKLSGGFQQG